MIKMLEYWLVPPGFSDFIRGHGYKNLFLGVRNRGLLRQLRRNRRFLNKHLGQRCFVLANGPSVRTQDLLPLRDEVVMSVSNGYLHKDFERIQPAYHFVPSIPYGKIKEIDCVRWFGEMDSRLGDTELFVGSSEYELIKRHSLFTGRKVNYFHVTRQFRSGETRIIDISGPVPGVITVPVLCILAALYMGFKEIYLIGTEHNTIVSREYKYAFEPIAVRGKDFSVTADGKSISSMYEELKMSALVWEQYRHVKRIAQANGIRIWNATAGGLLDEFARVDLAQVIGRS